MIGLLTLIVVGVLIGSDIGLSRIVAGGGEFYSGWQGARAFLFEHAGPYDRAVATQVQQLVYGRAARPTENPYILTIPFFLLPAFFPFALISDPNTARGLWMFLSELSLVGAALLSLQMIEWKPRRFFLVLYILLAIFGAYAVIALVDGTPAILLGLVFPATLYAYSNEEDELAGALLAVSLFYLEVGFLFLILILWKVFYERRWRILSGFAMSLLVLFIISLLMYPGWIFPFLSATLAALRSPFGISMPAVIAHLAPANQAIITQGVTLALIIDLIYEWITARGSDSRRFMWAAYLTLAATPLIGFRTEMSSLVVLFPSLPLIFAATANRWRGGYWLASLLLAIVLLVPWGLFIRWFSFQNQQAYDYMFLFYPLFTMAGLYWTRWWFVRPPRTWLDHVRPALN